MRIYPKDNIIKYWLDKNLPKYDVYFFKEKPSYIETISILEYIEKYDNRTYIDTYFQWVLKNTSKYVFVDKENNILKNENKYKILEEQINVGRGFVIPAIESDYSNELISPYICNNKLILSNCLFNYLDFENIKELFFRIVDDFDDNNINNIKIEIRVPEHIKNIANTYSIVQGFNCIGTTIFAYTANKKYIKYVLPSDLKLLVSNLEETTKIKSNSIVILEKDNQIIHVFFTLDEKIALNKNGQTIYNPICIKTIEDVLKDWEGEYDTLKIYH